jgi:hypothetical protein
MAGIIGTSLLGLPTVASGKTKSKKQQTKKVDKPAAQSSKGPSRRTTSPSPDYKSKYKKKDPPPNGGRPPRQKENRPPKIKIKNPPDGNGGRRPRFPRPGNDDRRIIRHPRLPRPGNDDPRIIPYPRPILPPIVVYPPVIIMEEYEEVYYEEEEAYYRAESANLIFAATSMTLNYVFIREGQINEFAAGVGFFFGITTLAIATRPNAKHPILGYLLGSASIIFSVWNLAGGMDNLHAYEGEVIYRDPYRKHVTTAPAGRTVGWAFSF